MKEWRYENNAPQNPWITDATLAKFCRARKFDTARAIEMFKNFLKYREENEIETIIEEFHFEEKEEAMQYWPRGYLGVDK